MRPNLCLFNFDMACATKSGYGQVFSIHSCSISVPHGLGKQKGIVPHQVVSVSHFDVGGFLEERRVGLESHVVLVGEEVDAVQCHPPARRRDELLVGVVRP